MTPEERMKALMREAREAPRPNEDDWERFVGRAHRSLMIQRVATGAGIAVVLVALAFGGTALLTSSEGSGDRPIPPADSPTAERTPTPTRTADETPQPINSYTVEQWFVKDDRLVVAWELVRSDPGIARTALNLLFSGPSGPVEETDPDVSTAIPEGTSLADIKIDDGHANVMMSGIFPDETDLQQQLATAQIYYTVAQFPTVDRVTLTWENPEQGGVSTQVQPKELEHLLPPIVVSQPYPAQEVESGGKVAGTANVFEATVSYRLVNREGDVLDEGFATATCGTGCRGDYSFKLKFDVDRPTFATLEVFESSAEDGSPLHTVTVPVNLIP